MNVTKTAQQTLGALTKERRCDLSPIETAGYLLPGCIFSNKISTMNNTKILGIVVLALVAAFFVGRCTAPKVGQVVEVEKTTVDTFYIDTPGKVIEKKGHTTYVINDDPAKDSLISVLEGRLAYTEVMADYYKAQIQAIGQAVPPAVVEATPPYNEYSGEALSIDSTARAAWRVKVYGHLVDATEGDPNPSIVVASTAKCPEPAKARTKAIGIGAGAKINRDGKVDFPVTAAYRKKYVCYFGRYYPTERAAEVGAMIEFQYK